MLLMCYVSAYEVRTRSCQSHMPMKYICSTVLYLLFAMHDIENKTDFACFSSIQKEWY